MQEPDEVMLYLRTFRVYVWLQLYEVGLQVVTSRAKKLTLLNMNFFKVLGVQDSLIFSSSMPSNSSKWWAIVQLVIKLETQVVGKC